MWYFSRAIDEYLVQDFGNALLDINRAVSLDSTFVLAYFLRAQVRMKEAEARELTATDAETGKPGRQMSGEYLLECRAALEDCERILRVDPDFAACYYNKGNIYMRMKSWDAAIDAYTKAVGYDTVSPRPIIIEG